MDRLQDIEEEIYDTCYQIKKLTDCGQPFVDETIKKTTLEIRYDEILMMLDQYQRSL
tara:strand:- start:7676 stop:7846 length:171 start_codon:yes stop_codon:yes gene_type:complete